jgi:hypothetical protein
LNSCNANSISFLRNRRTVTTGDNTVGDNINGIDDFVVDFLVEIIRVIAVDLWVVRFIADIDRILKLANLSPIDFRKSFFDVLGVAEVLGGCCVGFCRLG